MMETYLAANFVNANPPSSKSLVVDANTNAARTTQPNHTQVQTEPRDKAHQRTQCPLNADAQTQATPQSPAADAADAASQSSPSLTDSDARQLVAFLDAALPPLEEHLRRNLASNAFAGYDVSWETEHDQVECLHALKHEMALPETVPEGALASCTSVSWNASSSIVAVAYGALDRQAWADGESMLCSWSVTRRQLDPTKADGVVTLQHSLASVAFHPEDPSVLAGGSFSGEILLWRLSAEGDRLQCKTLMSEYSHHEPVQQLAWTRSHVHGGYLLCSVSADGKVLVWTPANHLRDPALGYRLPTEHRAVSGEATAAATLVGGGGGRGATLSFSAEDPTTFVVGLESGGIYKCALGANAERSVDAVRGAPGELPWSADAAALVARVPSNAFHALKRRVEREALLGNEKEVTLRAVFATQPDVDELFLSPALFSFDGHASPVYSVACSPFHRNIFASASTDGTVRVFHMLQAAPLLVLEAPPRGTPLFACAWSSARPAVLAVGSSDGNLHVYDLQRSVSRPAASLKVTSDGSAVYAVSFSPKEGGLVATADAQGVCRVWRLSHELGVFKPRESAFLDDLSPLTEE